MRPMIWLPGTVPVLGQKAPCPRKPLGPRMVVHHRTEMLSVSIRNQLSWVVACPVHRRMFINISGLYPLDASCTPSCDT